MKRFSGASGLPKPRKILALRRTERQDLARLIREDCMADDG